MAAHALSTTPLLSGTCSESFFADADALDAIIDQLHAAIDAETLIGDRFFDIALSDIAHKAADAWGSCETAPVGYDAIEKAFRQWRATLGEKARPYTLHGLRKLAIVELAEAGCSDAEIQAVTGQSPAMVAFYRKQANRKRLSRKAQERRG